MASGPNPSGPNPGNVRSIADIPGWFAAVDQWLFRHFLSEDAVAPSGNVVELGAFMGKSAAFIGSYLRAGETFTVCDLFGSDPGERSNERENQGSYANLTQDKFEQNYLAIHPELPVVVCDSSAAIVDHVPPNSVRFMHVDASHLFRYVAEDVRSAHQLLLPGGVVAFDDFRSPHTPGVAAAVWEAVFTQGLRPICLTRKKLYATFSDPAPHQELVVGLLSAHQTYHADIQEIGAAPVVRIFERPPAARPAARSAGATGAAPDPAVRTALAKVERRLSSLDRTVAGLQRQLAQPSTTERVARKIVRTVRRSRSERG